MFVNNRYQMYREAFNFVNFAIWDALAKIQCKLAHIFESIHFSYYVILVWILYGIQKSLLRAKSFESQKFILAINSRYTVYCSKA